MGLQELQVHQLKHFSSVTCCTAAAATPQLAAATQQMTKHQWGTCKLGSTHPGWPHDGRHLTDGCEEQQGRQAAAEGPDWAGCCAAMSAMSLERLLTWVGNFLTGGIQNSAGMQKWPSRKLAACKRFDAAPKGSGGEPQTLKPVHLTGAVRFSS